MALFVQPPSEMESVAKWLDSVHILAK